MKIVHSMLRIWSLPITLWALWMYGTDTFEAAVILFLVFIYAEIKERGAE